MGRKHNSTENNQDIETEKENSEVTLLGSSSYHEQNVRGISVDMSSFNEGNCKNIDKEIQVSNFLVNIKKPSDVLF